VVVQKVWREELRKNVEGKVEEVDEEMETNLRVCLGE
jgi:hypothetical protein